MLHKTAESCLKTRAAYASVLKSSKAVSSLAKTGFAKTLACSHPELPERLQGLRDRFHIVGLYLMISLVSFTKSL